MLDVLAVGPHPDDVELAAGGTLALLAGAGSQVGILDLTRGERGTRGDASVRASEAAEAARLLGVRSRECLEIPDGGVAATDAAQLTALIDVLRRRRPRLVIALHGNDDHPDHVEGAGLVQRAAYLAGLRNHPGASGEPFRPGRVLYAMGRRPFTPSLIVDTGGTHEIKQAAVRAYRSQFFREAGDPLTTPISDPEFLPRLEARDRWYGGMIGAAFGEPFLQEGPVAVRGPAGLLGEALS